MEVIKQDNKNIKKIITALENGAVLVLPTDTVYGLVCDAENEKAVEKIFSIKKRDKSKSLLVFVKNIKQAQKISHINKDQEKFLKNNWPGQVTVILKAKKGLSPLVYKDDTIGIRVPNHEFLNLILKKIKKPLAQTSANISDQPFPAGIQEIINVFSASEVKPDLLVDAGDLPNNKPSKIVDLTKGEGKVLRY